MAERKGAIGKGYAENSLTPRQTEVLHLAARGLNNVEIAETLSVEPVTARGYQSDMLRAFTVHTLAGAVFKALDLGMLNLYDLTSQYDLDKTRRLTRRNSDVLNTYVEVVKAGGLGSSREIARVLSNELNTIRDHFNKIFGILGVHGRLQAGLIWVAAQHRDLTEWEQWTIDFVARRNILGRLPDERIVEEYPDKEELFWRTMRRIQLKTGSQSPDLTEIIFRAIRAGFVQYENITAPEAELPDLDPTFPFTDQDIEIISTWAVLLDKGEEIKQEASPDSNAARIEKRILKKLGSEKIPQAVIRAIRGGVIKL